VSVDLCLFAAAPDIHEQGFQVHVLTGTAQELARQSLALGYDGFEYMPDPQQIPDADEFRRALELTGVVMPVVNSGRMVRQGLTLFHADPLVAARAKAAFCRMLHFAGAVGAAVGLGIARGPVREDLAPKEMDRLAEVLFLDLAEEAQRAGTVILLEPAETNVTRFVMTVKEVMAWVDRIASPAFSVMLDTHQLVENESSIEHGISAARGEARHIHLFDPERFPPGTHPQGLDWKHIFSLLEQEGFSGSASLALPHQSQPHSPADVARFLRQHVSGSASVADGGMGNSH
jgi:sugar phosphate isomerase/epimerase